MTTTLSLDSLTTTVREMNPFEDARWEEFVRQHPEGLIYHHPAWLGAVVAEYGQSSVFLGCESRDGQLIGIFPLMYTRGMPFSKRRPLTGPRLSSLPRTPLAGPLAVSREATADLLQEALRRSGLDGNIRVQIKTQGTELDGIVGGLEGTAWRFSYVLDLPGRLNAEYRVGNAHSRQVVKWAVNKAIKAGVRVRKAETEGDLREWYRLYLETMRHNLVPARSYRFFESLWRGMKPAGMFELLVAEHEDQGRVQMVAGSIFLMFGGTVSYVFNGSSRRHFVLRPNDAIQWEAITAACKNGFRKFDFGEVPDGNEDLAKFKSKWGAAPVRLYRYYWPAVAARPNEEAPTQEGRSTRIVRAIWQRVPLWATAWAGDRAYSRL